MIIECPSCSAKFNVPDGALDAGPRKMKCSKCAFLWTAHPPKAQAPVVEEVKEIPLAAAPKPSRKGKTPEKLKPLEIALASTAGALVAVVAVLMALSFAPKLLGFNSTDGLGLSALAITSERVEGGERFEPMESFAITGTITNNSVALQHVPIVRVRAITKNGSVIYTKKYTADDRMIPPGEAFDFNIEGLNRLNPEITRFLVDIGGGLELMLRSQPSEPDA